MNAEMDRRKANERCNPVESEGKGEADDLEVKGRKWQKRAVAVARCFFVSWRSVPGRSREVHCYNARTAKGETRSSKKVLCGQAFAKAVRYTARRVSISCRQDGWTGASGRCWVARVKEQD